MSDTAFHVELGHEFRISVNSCSMTVDELAAVVEQIKLHCPGDAEVQIRAADDQRDPYIRMTVLFKERAGAEGGERCG